MYFHSFCIRSSIVIYVLLILWRSFIQRDSRHWHGLDSACVDIWQKNGIDASKSAVADMERNKRKWDGSFQVVHCNELFRLSRVWRRIVRIVDHSIQTIALFLLLIFYPHFLLSNFIYTD